MEIISTLLTGIRFFTGDLGRRRRAAWNKLKAKARTSLAGRVLRQGNARMKTKQYSTTDGNQEKCILLKLTTKTAVRVILWLSIATDHTLAKNPRPSEQTASTNLNRWESIDYPSIRLSPDSGRSNSWVSVRIVNSSIGPFMGVTSSGESTPFSTRDGSLAVRLHRPSGETVIPEEPLRGPVGINDGGGKTGSNGFGFLFRGVSNTLEEAWIELKIAKQRFWLEVPYGFTQIRDGANQRLGDFPQEREFLAKRVEVETSLDILMRLMYQAQEREEFNQRFVGRVYSLLMHPNDTVRRDALLFIG